MRFRRAELAATSARARSLSGPASTRRVTKLTDNLAAARSQLRGRLTLGCADLGSLALYRCQLVSDSRE